jgi:hypothetical protein
MEAIELLDGQGNFRKTEILSFDNLKSFFATLRNERDGFVVLPKGGWKVPWRAASLIDDVEIRYILSRGYPSEKIRDLITQKVAVRKAVEPETIDGVEMGSARRVGPGQVGMANIPRYSYQRISRPKV